MGKKRKMALGAENMPDDVYKILNEKSNSRKLTSYVVELVQNEQRYKQLMQKLDSVENKLNQLLSSEGVTTPKQINLISEDRPLKEGKLIDAKEIIGGISKEDNEEVDF